MLFVSTATLVATGDLKILVSTIPSETRTGCGVPTFTETTVIGVPMNSPRVFDFAECLSASRGFRVASAATCSRLRLSQRSELRFQRSTDVVVPGLLVAFEFPLDAIEAEYAQFEPLRHAP